MEMTKTYLSLFVTLTGNEVSETPSAFAKVEISRFLDR